ncbi:hypothetical protein [Campylobacter geochelonis]|uniref:Uncharacterized protein n=1 Tax=Campylobacter geochelonis TaxID=1780362 RepID=A0A128EBQ1_9BACT|nr:hypothetical protein [Campylobacter geochelonis]CZE46385.1 Uncharacterised protein [Campylobacter geochelonis]
MPKEYADINITDCNIKQDFFPQFSCVEQIGDNEIKLRNVLVVSEKMIFTN